MKLRPKIVKLVAMQAWLASLPVIAGQGVDFNGNGGLVNGGVSQRVEATRVNDSNYRCTVISSTAIVAPEGKRFNGWFSAIEGGTEYRIDVIVPAGMYKTVYAQWIDDDYYVNFDANGGTGTMPTQRLVQGINGLLATNAYSRGGYVFAGWSASSSATTVKFADGAAVRTMPCSYNSESGRFETTLYAVWKYTYKVRFEANGGTGSMADQTMVQDREESLNICTFTPPLGKVFRDWKVSTSAYDDGQSVCNLARAGETIVLTAEWSEQTYRVLLNSNGGEGGVVTNAEMTVSGSLPGKSKSPELLKFQRIGYSFANWNTASDGNNGSSFADGCAMSEIVAALGKIDTYVLYAQWKAETYKVSFVGGDDASVIPSLTYEVEYGKPYGTLSSATRAGYQFLGWFTEKDGGERISEEAIVSVAGDHALYAHWAAAVTFDPNGGTVETLSIVVGKGEPYGELPIPVRSGYAFTGWFTAVTAGTQVLSTTVMLEVSPCTVYAHWTPLEGVVRFDAAGGYVAVPAKTVVYDSVYEELPSPMRSGYSFEGWYTASAGGMPITEGMKVEDVGNMTLYAHWSANRYQLNFDVNGGDGAPDSKEVTYDSAYGDLPEPTRFSHTFVGWFTQPDGGVQVTKFDTVAVLSDQNLYAHWLVNSYVVSFDSGHGAGDATGEMAVQEFYYGETKALSSNAYERVGHSFFGWTTNGTEIAFTDGEIVSNLTADAGGKIELEAMWVAKEYTIRFDANHGSNITETITVAYGDPYGELPITEREHHDFLGWFTAKNGGDAVSAGDVLSVAANQTLYAHWQLKTNAFNEALGIDVAYFDSDNWYVDGDSVCAPAHESENDAKLNAVFYSDFGGTLYFDWKLECTSDNYGGEKLYASTLLMKGLDSSPYDISGSTNLTVSAGDGTNVLFRYTNIMGGFVLPFGSDIFKVKATISNMHFEPHTPTIVPIPEPIMGLTYNGEVQIGVQPGTHYSILSNAYSEASNYVAKATLNSGDFAWSDNTTNDIEIAWAINKANYDMGRVAFVDGSFAADGEEKSLFIVGDLPDGVSVAYEGNGVSEIGEYSVTAVFSVADPVNYETPAPMVATLSIFKPDREVPLPSAKSGLMYTGSAIVGVDAVDGCDLVGNVATNAGEYEAIATLREGFVWSDGSDEDRKIRWSIARATHDLSGVALSSSRCEYDGTAKTLIVTGLPPGVVAIYDGNVQTAIGVHAVTIEFAVDEVNYEPIPSWNRELSIFAYADYPNPIANELVYSGDAITGVVASVGVSLAGNVATNAGSYVATAVPDDGYVWRDGSTAPTNIDWTIFRSVYDMSEVILADATFAYDGEPKSLAVSGSLPDGVSVEYEGNGVTDPGDHEVTAYFKGDAINYEPIADQTATLTIVPPLPTAIDIPTAARVLVYDGSALTGVVASTGFTVIGNVATNAGSYVATVTPGIGYVWRDGSTAPVNVGWTISKSAYDMSAVTLPDAEFVYDGQSKSLAVVGELPDGVSVRYEGNGQTQIGRYEVRAIFTGDAANYESIYDLTATLAIRSPYILHPDKVTGETLGEFTAVKAASYNGWLRDQDGDIVGLIVVKTGAAKSGKDSKVTITMTPLGGKKKTYRTTVTPGGNPTDEFGVVYGSMGLGGTFNGYAVEASQDFAKAKVKSEKDLAKTYPLRTWTMAIAADDEVAAFSVTVSKTGKAKVSGTLADGTKVSLSPMGALGVEAFAVPVTYSKKGVDFGFVLWIPLTGEEPAVVGMTPAGWRPLEVGALQPLSDGRHLFDFGVPEPPDATKDYIDRIDGISVFGDGEEFRIESGKWKFDRTVGKVKIADGVPYVDCKAGKVPANLSSLKLSYTAKTGIVKGSFKLYYVVGGKLKNDKATVYGVVVNGRLFGSGVIKKQPPFDVSVE